MPFRVPLTMASQTSNPGLSRQSKIHRFFGHASASAAETVKLSETTTVITLTTTTTITTVTTSTMHSSDSGTVQMLFINPLNAGG